MWTLWAAARLSTSPQPDPGEGGARGGNPLPTAACGLQAPTAPAGPQLELTAAAEQQLQDRIEERDQESQREHRITSQEGMPVKIQLHSNDRVSIIAKSGAGKSVAARALTRPIRRLIFFDYKREVELPEAVYVHGLAQLRALDLDAGARVVYRPETWSWDEWDAVCYWSLDHRPYTVVQDEAGLFSSPARITPGHQIIQQAGRSMGVGIFNLTQRPRMVYKALLSEANHRLVGYLELPEDRKYLRGLLGSAAVDQVGGYAPGGPEQFQFVYMADGLPQPVILQPFPQV